MADSLRLFVGFDPKESVAYHVLCQSILRQSSIPVSITPLVQAQLRAQGLYTRPRGPTESTEFSLTRFLVPYLAGYQGWAVFLDCDMLFRCDAVELWHAIENASSLDARGEQESRWSTTRFGPPKSVLVCQHDYTPREGVKFGGHVQTVYPRKNWSSLMAFNADRCRALTPEYVNSATGLQLHRFQWTTDAEIGSLPVEFNHLVGDYPPNPEAKILHYTLGTPCFPEYADCDHADLWHAELDRMLTPLTVVSV